MEAATTELLQRNQNQPQGGGVSGGLKFERAEAGLDFARLENVHPHGQKTIARCPACAEEGHDKSGEHLVIEPDGRFGCVIHEGPEGALHRRRIYKLARKESGNRASSSVSHQRLFNTLDDAIHALERNTGAGCSHRWRYENGDGTTAYEVCRFETPKGKTFRPVTKETGGWRIGSMKQGTRPLYRLPQLLQAEPEETVFVVEGEKCADALTDLGLVATTSAHGARSAPGTIWTPLAGKDVVLLPDNDGPGGEYARTVRQALAALTPPANLRVITLPGIDAIGEGADVYDWLQGREPGNAREELLHLAAEAPVEPLSQDLMLVVSAADWLLEPEPPPPDYLLDGVFERQDKVLIVGPTKSRKSFLAMQLALCLTAGVPFIGLAVPHACRVLLIDLENRQDWVKRRLRKCASGLGLSSVQTGSLHIMCVRGERLDSVDHHIENALHAYSPDVVIIDPVYKLDPDDENDQASRKRLLAKLGELTVEIGCAVVLVHHDPKGDPRLRDVRDRGSGSSVLNRDVDVTIAIRPKPRQKWFEAGQEIEILARNAPPEAARCVHFVPEQYFVPVSLSPTDKSSAPVSQTGVPKVGGRRKHAKLDEACSLLTEPQAITKYCDQLRALFGFGKKTARDLAEEVGTTDGYTIAKLRKYPHTCLIGPREAVEIEVARLAKD